jgi:ADP-ribose pyrophosphatase YjhB (NUDIX family)
VKRAACIFIIEGDKILATSRKDNPNDFGLLGGKCKEGESFEDAAVRELFEESGFRAYDLHFVFERRDKEFIVKTFMPEKWFGKLPTDEEQKKKGEGRVKWATVEELLEGSFGDYNRNLFKYLGIIK